MMRKIIATLLIFVLVFAGLVYAKVTYTIKEQEGLILYGLEKYSSKRIYTIDKILYEDNQIKVYNYLTPGQNFQLVKLKLEKDYNISYNETRAWDPAEFLVHGGDCYDYTMFLIGLLTNPQRDWNGDIGEMYSHITVYIVVSNIEFPDGHVEGHMFPIFVYKNEENVTVYGVYDIPTNTYFELKNTTLENSLKKWENVSGLKIMKIMVYKLEFENGEFVGISPIYKYLLFQKI